MNLSHVGEGNPWRQTRVLKFFHPDELLIGRDYWNKVCKSPDGFDMVVEQYSRSTIHIRRSLESLKENYS